jgi:hypothetical protein
MTVSTAALACAREAITRLQPHFGHPSPALRRRPDGIETATRILIMTAFARRRLLAVRAPRKTPQGRRIRSLFRSFIAKLDPDDPLHQARALRAAELAVAAEDARAKLLAGDASIEEAVTRLENAARRAEHDLTHKPKRMTAAERRRQWLEQQDDSNAEG